MHKLFSYCIWRYLVSRACDWVMQVLSAVLLTFSFQFSLLFFNILLSRPHQSHIYGSGPHQHCSVLLDNICLTTDVAENLGKSFSGAQRTAQRKDWIVACGLCAIVCGLLMGLPVVCVWSVCSCVWSVDRVFQWSVCQLVWNIYTMRPSSLTLAYILKPMVMERSVVILCYSSLVCWSFAFLLTNSGYTRSS